MKNTPYSARGSEFYGEFALWQRANAADNESDLRRLKRNLRLAREQELTPRQQEMLHLRFEEELSVGEIAVKLGVHKSTVSRTLARAERRLERALRYTI